MVTYQHRTKQSLDHISPRFSLSRDHNKLCLGQCSRLSEFGVAKVRPRAGLLSTQDRSVPRNSPIPAGCDSPSCLHTMAQHRGRHLLLVAQTLHRHNTQIFLSVNPEKALPKQNSFWESASSEDWANWKEHILLFWCKYHFLTLSGHFPL